MPRPFLALVLAPGVLAGCGPVGDRASDAPVRRDSAGIEIVEFEVPQGPDAPTWRVDPAPIFTPDPAQSLAEFQAVFQVVRLSDGTIVALDAQPPYVRAFAPDGSVRWTAIAEGDGPDEMREPSLLTRLRGDTLAVDDRMTRGLLLTNQGSIVGELPSMGLQSRQGEAFRAPLLLMRLAAGTGVGVTMDYRFSDFEGTGVFTFEGPAQLLARTGEMSAFARWRIQDAPRTGSSRFVSMLLGAMAAYAPAPTGFVYGFPKRDELIVYDAEGDVRRILRGRAVPREPSDEEVERARAAYIESRGGKNTEELRREVLQMTINDTLPLFGRVLVGRDGAIWRERFDPGTRARQALYAWPDDGAAWDVFAADGRWLALVTMPPRFVLTDAGDDWIAGFQVDELDVQSPRVHVLRKN